MRRLFFFFLISDFCLLTSVFSKDLGTYGETFAIAEENLLHVIQGKLQKMIERGELPKKQQELSFKAKARLRHPAPLQDITKTTLPRRWLYDPSLTLEHDIKDHQGKIIATKGTVVNPLDHLSWGAPLLFLDGEDPQQVAWADSQDALAKWVLVKGSPLDLEEEKKRPIYFDQAGMLVSKFGIKQVPCRIRQKDKKLLVEEIMTLKKE